MYKGRRMYFYLSEGKTILTGWSRIPENPQDIRIAIFGQDTSPLKEFVDDAIVHS